MKRNLLKTIIKTFLIFVLLTGSYYFLILKPKIIYTKNLTDIKKILTKDYLNLAQNRLAFIELTRLDTQKQSFENEKSDLVATLKKTNSTGSELADEANNFFKQYPENKEKYTLLIEKTKSFYEKQNKLLEKVFATKSYQEGLAILKSKEAVEILTNQTNLILEMKFQLQDLERELEKLQSPPKKLLQVLGLFPQE